MQPVQPVALAATVEKEAAGVAPGRGGHRGGRGSANLGSTPLRSATTPHEARMKGERMGN
jgi:hypothetical protein